MRESKRAFGSDLAKLDATTDEQIARQIAEDPDTVPELTDEWLDNSELWDGDRLIGRVGPRAAARRRWSRCALTVTCSISSGRPGRAGRPD